MASKVLSEIAFVFPVQKVRRRIETDSILNSQRHNPFLFLLMPYYFRISKIPDSRVVQDRVFFIFGPGFSCIKAIGDSLGLKIILSLLFSFSIVISENGNNRWGFPVSQAGGILMVYNGTTRKNSSVFIGFQGNRLLLPVYHIGTRGMAPVHRPPDIIIGIMLKKEMISPVEVKHTIRVIHPSGFWREMETGTKIFVGLHYCIIFRRRLLCITILTRREEYASQQKEKYALINIFHDFCFDY